jgi:hypothetical protein
MSKAALRLIQAISFLDDQYQVGPIDTLPEAQLKQRIAYYFKERKSAANSEAAELSEAKLQRSTFRSSISASNTVEAICPTLLVHDAVVIDDPLFDFCIPTSAHTTAEKQAMGLETSSAVNRVNLRKILTDWGQFAPLVDSGFLQILPVALLHMAPAQLQLNFPQNRYRELVPDAAVELVLRSVIVRPIEKSEHGMLILPEPNINRMPHLAISFKDDEATKSMSFYNYREITVGGQNPDGTVSFSDDAWSDANMDQALYDVWIEQVTNQTVGCRLQAIAKEMQLADRFGIPYSTQSKFEAELLARSGVVGGSASADSVNFLEANRDLLNLSDPLGVLRLRTDNAHLLSRFRLSLGDLSSELRDLDEGQFAQRARHLFEREITPQIQELNAAISKIYESGAKGLLQTGSALLLAVLTGPSVSVAALLGLAAMGIVGEALPAVGEYRRKRTGPEFIWHKLAKQ